MKRISSEENPTIKRFLKILKKPEKFAPSIKQPEGEVIAEGPRVVEMALQRGIRIGYTLVTNQFISDERNSNLMDRLLQRKVQVIVVEHKALKRVSDTVTPQGIVAICKVKASTLADTEGDLVVVVDRVQDPGNMGSIIRVSDAVGVGSVVVIKGSVSPFNTKSIRASAGSVFNLKICFCTIEELLDFSKKRGYKLVGTDIGAELSVYDFNPAGAMMVAFGNETHGISEEIRKEAGALIKVPIYGKAESLNVGSSAAVVLYELRRKLAG